MEFIDQIKNTLFKILPDNYHSMINNNNILTTIIILIALSIYNKNLNVLSSLLAHPFILLILILVTIHYFKENKFGLASSIIFLIIISIFVNLDNKEISKPIINTEHFSNSKKIDIKSDDEIKSVSSDDTIDSQKSNASTDSSVSEQLITKNKNQNLNDTFKNLHDAIHQLENFMDKSKQD